MLEISIFFVLTLFVLGGALAMLMNRETLFSAFGFLITMIALAGMFALLDNSFLALAQIMVSVGAVVVLSMLTIMTLNAKEENLPKEPHKFKWLLGTSFLVAPFTAVLFTTLNATYKRFSEMQNVTTKSIGEQLFSGWVLPFEVVSILLLTGMLGAIVIGRKQRLTKKESR